MSNDTPNPSWATIEDFPLYEVSSHGEVRNRETGKLRSLSPDRWGYLKLSLSRDGKLFTRKVHRLVLESFVGPCPAGLEGCHGDGDKRNNSIENLRWDTHQANMDDLIKTGALTVARRRRTKTHCPQGHELGGANRRKSSMACLACNRARGFAQSRHIPFTKALADEYYLRLST